MRTFILIITLGGVIFSAVAQYNLSSSCLYHHDVYASRLMPSQLNLGTKNVQISLPGLGGSYLYAGNTIIGFSQIANTVSSNSLDMKDLYENADKKRLIMGLGGELLVLGIAAQIPITQERKLNLSYSASQRAAAYLELPNSALEFIYKGNGTEFRGKTANLGKITLSGSVFAQHAVQLAMPIFGNDGTSYGIGLRAGIGLKILSSQGGVYMKNAKIDVYTEQNGNYIVLDRDFSLSYTDFPNQFNIQRRQGRGIGFDIGTTLYYGEHLEFVSAVTDIGRLSFNQNVVTFSRTGVDTVRGVITSFLGGGSGVDINATTQNLIEVNEQRGGTFRMPLGARLLLQPQYKIHRKTTLKGREYYKRRIFLTYMQGLQNSISTTTRPYFNFAYNHAFGSAFNAGLSIGYGGINRTITSGLFVGVTSGTFKFGLGSDNLIGLVVPSLGTGVDIGANLILAF
ncbi:MAG: DUF5723 family protein [Cytophagales bacterium]|nr:DUF5723 family protein [Cytophagales bacterium]MDW8383397.1 DUF5723 family protein [Flammeovirgaceae bacterium]